MAVRYVVLMSALTLVVACSGGEGGVDAGTATLPTAVPTVPRVATTLSPSTTAAATSSSSSSSSTSSSVVLLPVPPSSSGVVELSADGPWRRVDSAPGVTTAGLFYELMPGLWAYLPQVADIPNRIYWTLNETDRPIIEDYLMAMLTYYRSVSQRPMDFSSPDWDTYFTTFGKTLGTNQLIEDKGRYLELDQGVVLRPTVSGDNLTTTTRQLWDCVLNGAVYRNGDGTLAPGSSLGVAPNGRATNVVLIDGVWKLDVMQSNIADLCR